MLPITRKISAYNYSSSNNITYIVIHDVGATSTAADNASYFGGGNRGSSAHYFVDENSIYQVVEDYHGSWHCGDGKGAYGITNRNSIGIEMCLTNGDVTEKTEANCIELVKYLMSKYNVPLSRVVRHYDASRKSCPNQFRANNWLRWNNFKTKLSGGTVSTPTVNETPSTSTSTPNDPVAKAKEFVGSRCKELQEKLIKLGYNCGGYGADGTFGNGTYNSLIQFQKDNGLSVDGLAGTNTFAKLDSLLAYKSQSSNNGDSWIKRLQQECNNQGFSNQAVDGIAGTNTLNGCPTLKKGAQGNITKLLQERLGISADGIFGSNTKAAVIGFQNSNGLSADGIVGKNTWRKLLGL